MLEHQVSEPDALKAIGDIKGTVQQAIDRLRYLLFELRPPVLDREGLGAALRIYLERMASDTGVEVELQDEMVQEPPGELRGIAFRIAQEALSNIRKHAEASKVAVALSGDEEGFTVRISDDGIGFDPSVAEAPEPGHLGLPTMRERAELTGGTWRLESAPGRGTTVEFRVPFEERDPESD
jgi:signal transduction histidine kinase